MNPDFYKNHVNSDLDSLKNSTLRNTVLEEWSPKPDVHIPATGDNPIWCRDKTLELLLMFILKKDSY